MKLQSVPPGVTKLKCEQCGRLCTEGQQVLHQRFDKNRYGDREKYWHAICIQALLDGLPTNGAVRRHLLEKDMKATREKVLSSGDLFA